MVRFTWGHPQTETRLNTPVDSCDLSIALPEKCLVRLSVELGIYAVLLICMYSP